MAYLDVSPMINALQRSPDQFAFATGSLHHIPSGHSFEFDRSGLVNIRAQCACSHLEISRDQERQLSDAFRAWQVNYWRPLEINKQFADHFALSWWQRAMVATTGWLFRVSLKLARRPHELESARVPAE